MIMDLQGSIIDFPFRGSIRGGLATTSDKQTLIAQAIADVIETRQGERVMLPDYGLPDFVFSVVDAGFAGRLKYHIAEQITKYVPLVESVKVAVGATDTDGKFQTNGAIDASRVSVSINYFERGAVNAPQNLVFPVWQLIK